MVNRAGAARSVLWSAVENGGLALISFITLIVYSRLLSPADFGLFSIVFALVELLGVLVSMTFHDALVQRKDVTDLHFDTAFTATVALSLFLAALCAILAPQFARVVHEPKAVPVLMWMSLCFPATGATATIVAHHRRVLSFRSLALRSLAGRLTGAAVGLALVALGMGMWGLVAQQVLIRLTGSVVLWACTEHRPRFRFGSKEFRELIGFGAFSVGTLLLDFSVRRVFTILTGIFLGAEAAGYLNISLRIVDVLWAVAATAVSQVTLPLLAALQSDRERLRHTYRMATQFTCVVLYACFVGLALSAPELIELLFGAKWLPASPYVSVLALLILVQVPRLFVAPTLTALGRPRDAMAGMAIELVFMLAALLLSRVPTVGWAVSIWAIRELVGLLLMSWILRRATGFTLRQQFAGAMVPLAAAMSMVAGLAAVRYLLPPDFGAWQRLTVSVPVGLALFVSSLWLMDRSIVTKMMQFASVGLHRKST